MGTIRAARDSVAVWGAHRLAWLAGRAAGRTYVGLDYPPSVADTPRWGWGHAPHAGLRALLSESDETTRAELDTILGYRDALTAITVDAVDPIEPHWVQSPVWLLGLDTASLYAQVRSRAPARYVEVGSGNSTKVVARARRDGALSTHITSIDPHPRAEIDRLCDRVIRQPMELAGPAAFAELQAGDMVFFDGSHRAFMNSDVTVFFLEVLPSLPAGVIVGIHDILLPWDYPPDCGDRYYSEQYLLAAQLLARDPRVRTLLPCHHVSTTPELAQRLAPLWDDPRLAGVDRRGYAYWLELQPGS